MPDNLLVLFEARRSKGFEIIKENGCLTCHRDDKSEDMAPSFRKIREGYVTVIENEKELRIQYSREYLKEAIMNPWKNFVKGFERLRMPEYNSRLSDDELELVIDYLEGVK